MKHTHTHTPISSWILPYNINIQFSFFFCSYMQLFMCGANCGNVLLLASVVQGRHFIKQLHSQGKLVCRKCTWVLEWNKNVCLYLSWTGENLWCTLNACHFCSHIVIRAGMVFSGCSHTWNLNPILVKKRKHEKNPDFNYPLIDPVFKESKQGRKKHLCYFFLQKLICM
jgi:hypothetical protein